MHLYLHTTYIAYRMVAHYSTYAFSCIQSHLSVCIYLYVYIYVCIWIHAHAYICVQVYWRLYIFLTLHVFASTYISVRVCVSARDRAQFKIFAYFAFDRWIVCLVSFVNEQQKLCSCYFSVIETWRTKQSHWFFPLSTILLRI